MINILDWESFNEGYNKPRAGGKRRWSVKYKKKIDCSNPKGFSQKQYCKRKRRGGNYKTESVQFNSMKSELEQIFFDVSDVSSWYVTVDEHNTSLSQDCLVYISFGDEDSYHRENDGEDWGYPQKEINEELIDCIKRSIDVMSEEGFSYQLSFCEEYSHHPEEDIISKIEVDDLYDGMIMSENESIRIEFKK
jgi:hypothetical protein